MKKRTTDGKGESRRERQREKRVCVCVCVWEGGDRRKLTVGRERLTGEKSAVLQMTLFYRIRSSHGGKKQHFNNEAKDWGVGGGEKKKV